MAKIGAWGAMRIALAGIWLAWCGGPASAQQAASPQELKADVEWILDVLAKSGQAGVVLQATDLIADMQGGVPGVTLRNAAAGLKNSGRAELGDIRAVERQATPGMRRIAFPLPKVIDLYSEAGQLLPPPIHVADAALNIDFPLDRSAITRLEFSGQSIHAQEPDATLNVGRFSFVAESINARGDDCVVTLDLDGLLLRAVNDDRLKIDKLVIKHDLVGMNAGALERASVAMSELQKAVDVHAHPEAALRQLVTLPKTHGTLMSAIKQSIRIGGLEFVNVAQKQDFRLAGFVLEQDIDGFETGIVDWRIVSEYAGLESRQTSVDARLFATGMAIDLTIKDIPAGRMMEALAQSFDRFPVGQGDPELPAVVKDIASAAGIRVRINRLAFTTPRLAGQGAGQFTLDASAALFGTGEALIAFYGLSELEDGIRTQRDTYDPPTARTILFLASLSVPSHGPDGRPVRVMRVQFGRDGKLMVNGKDLTPPPPQRRVP